MKGGRPARLADRRIGPATGQLFGWMMVAAVHAAVIFVTMPRSPGAFWVRVLHHAYDAGRMIALGLLASAAIEAWRRWGPSGARWGYGALALVSLAAGALLLSSDLDGPAERLGDDRFYHAWLAALVAVVASGIVAAAAVGRLLDRPYFRFAGVAAAIGATAMHPFLLSGDYPGAHFYAAWGAATLFGTSIAGARLPSFSFVTPASALRLRGAAWLLRGVFAVAAAWLIVIPPSSAVAVELLRAPGVVLSPFLTWFHEEDPGILPVTGPALEWFADRTDLPDIAPSTPPLLPPDGIVIVITVDALRADVLANPGYAAPLREMRRLREQSIDFTMARSVAPQTVATLMALFTGKYYSQIYWTKKAVRGRGRVWPHEDHCVHFPEILQKAGIPTAAYSNIRLFEYTMLRGFDDVFENPYLDRTPPAREIVPKVLDRLDRQSQGPLFLYTHLFDPHSPYDLAGTSGTSFERYLREVGLIDQALGIIRRKLEQRGLSGRTAIILTADHGEAFGEHNTYKHAVSVYDELLRVPLLVYVPGIRPRKVTEPVSTVDLAPTILDLMGLPTPGSFMGQSLTPYLRGEAVALSRPLAVESGRRMRAMIFADGLKVIENLRLGTVEIYDLSKDPDERDNLESVMTDEHKVHLNTLRAFFRVHKLKRPGYVVPYRP